MNIILFDSNEITSPIPLNDPRCRHIIRILKLTEGDCIRAGVVNGKRGTAKIVRISNSGVRFEFDLDAPTLPFHPLRIICGLPRPQQAKRILRDCTSMGVSHIAFTQTELGEKSYRHSPLWQNNTWHHSVREGVEQSGGTLFPEIHLFAHLRDCLAHIPENATCVALDVETASTHGEHHRLLPDQVNETVLIIGSERGWTDAERDRLRGFNCRFFHLGHHILRTDTACIAATTLAISDLKCLQSD